MKRSAYQAGKMPASPYNTRSMPLIRDEKEDEPIRRGKASAIVSRERLRRQRGGVERATAWIVLLVSVFGSVAALAGGWQPLIAGIVTRHPQWYAIVGGIGLQVALTFLEWYYFDSPLVSWPARLLDTVLTALGYGPLVFVSLVAFLAARHVPQPVYVADGIILLFSLAVAWYPESRLVD